MGNAFILVGKILSTTQVIVPILVTVIGALTRIHVGMERLIVVPQQIVKGMVWPKVAIIFVPADFTSTVQLNSANHQRNRHPAIKLSTIPACARLHTPIGVLPTTYAGTFLRTAAHRQTVMGMEV